MSHSVQSEPNEAGIRPLTFGAGLVSAGAIAFLLWLIYYKPKADQHEAWVDLLPWLNALFNACAAACLVYGYGAVRKKQISRHRGSMLAAVGFSTLFLVSYVIYHAFHAESRFPGQGWVRPLYFFILVSHIGLSAVSLPLVLTTLALGLRGRFAVHRKVARWTLPLWLYVSVTGVLIVIFLKAYGA